LRDTHYQLGRCYFESGNHRQAILEFHKEMRLSGEAPDIYLQIGSIYFSLALDNIEPMDNLQNAKEAFERGIQIEPSFNGLRRSLNDVLTVISNQE
jgi:tetratricopeptide (TPR) repeat protein